jgi:hypothetical protein
MKKPNSSKPYKENCRKQKPEQQLKPKAKLQETNAKPRPKVDQPATTTKKADSKTSYRNKNPEDTNSIHRTYKPEC